MRRLVVFLLSALFLSSFASAPALASPGVKPAAPGSGITGAAAWQRPRAAAVRARRIVRWYVIRPGDTLSSIARRELGSGWRWMNLWWANRRMIANPDVVRAGQRIALTRWHRVKPWLQARALAAIPPPPAEHQVTVHHHSHAWSDPVGTFTATTQQAVQSYGGGYPGGAFGACVVARESGGNPEIMNATGHWGLYQFSAATWAAYGGNPADFGTAGVAEQNQVFANALARGGQDNWAPYDGC